MIRRLLARHRLEFCFHAAWVSHRVGKRPRGPRPILALHRLPDPNCSVCGGTGDVLHGWPGCEEPDVDTCDCAPFLPLAYVWLPKWPRWARKRWICPACGTRSRTCGCHSTQPPF
ncbi:hypothetical protein [Streptomyces sp. NPDC046197]|uniref:hypothetical protein n=1 Tax=Streptomyces sp. NPDC046197 TaxID=3154337 RepID=UPI0034030ADD